MKRIFITGALLLALVSLAVAADFWVSKPYTKWSQTDAVKMLTDSPWAKTVTIPVGNVPAPTNTRSQLAEETQVQQTLRYNVSLRSAAPVRQAVARMAAITNKYDKMDDAAKQQFDEHWKKYIDTPFADVIVVTIGYRSSEPMLDRQLVMYFQAQTLDTIKPTMKLALSDGKKLDPVSFSTDAHEMQVVFPRPAGLSDTGALTVEFQHPPLRGDSPRRIAARFQLKDMKFAGAPAF